MLSSIAAITIPLLLLMFIAFFIFEHNRKKRIAEHKVALNGLISDLKQSYKLDVTTLSDEGQLSNSHREKLYMIANNFFIYQAINEENVALFELSLKNLSQSYNSALAYITQGGNVEEVLERIELFIENLPSHNRGFNANFYQSSLTAINQLLKMPEPQLDNEGAVLSENQLLEKAGASEKAEASTEFEHRKRA